MQAIEQLLTEINKNPYLAVPLMIWTMVWKGLALWKAADKKDKIWFIALLVLNTLGLVEILYFFIFSKKANLAPLSSLSKQDPLKKKLLGR